LWYTI